MMIVGGASTIGSSGSCSSSIIVIEVSATAGSAPVAIAVTLKV
jgi:hypothetical protein